MAEDAHRWPPEWAPQEAVWLAWPWDRSSWGDDLDGARVDTVGLVVALAGERVRLLVPPGAEAEVAAALAEAGVEHGAPDGAAFDLELVPCLYGDVWLRDTGPLFARRGAELVALDFQWNGWGGKYLFEHDAEVGARIAELAGAPVERFPWILEGGAVEGDGAGTVLTTRQCLLHPNRGGEAQETWERRLGDALGAARVIWLDEGLRNDHTDGHVDTLARFVAPGRVVCMEARSAGDPNREALSAVRDELLRARDAAGRRLEVAVVPSPGEVLDGGGQLLPASFVNFLITDDVVVVPVYDTPWDDDAVRDLGTLFPDRRVVGAPAASLLRGGGAFHCVSQHQPAVAEGGGPAQPDDTAESSGAEGRPSGGAPS